MGRRKSGKHGRFVRSITKGVGREFSKIGTGIIAGLLGIVGLTRPRKRRRW